jgi:hypothetical protein
VTVAAAQRGRRARRRAAERARDEHREGGGKRDQRASAGNAHAIVISPSTPHVRTALALNDYSALRVWERMLGLPCVNAACNAPAMGKPFHL